MKKKRKGKRKKERKKERNDTVVELGVAPKSCKRASRSSAIPYGYGGSKKYKKLFKKIFLNFEKNIYISICLISAILTGTPLGERKV